MKKLALLFVLFFLISCSGASSFRANSTRRNLDNIDIGMSKEDVVNIMGSPYQRDVFIGEDGQFVEVLLYQTKFVGMANSPTDYSLTPIVFKSNQLIGWGRNFYDTTKRYSIKQDIEMRSP
jgi:hypothetical protein